MNESLILKEESKIKESNFEKPHTQKAQQEQFSSKVKPKYFESQE